MGRNPEIDPALKSWIDHVLVPAMVTQCLAEAEEVGDNVGVRYPFLDSVKEHIQFLDSVKEHIQ
jgi:hypothetical protein